MRREMAQFKHRKGGEKMRILNFGSMNIDYVYSVDHMVKPGETISSTKLELFCGGKGLNQSIALARAGAPVCHAGMIGLDGDMLLRACKENGVDTHYIQRTGERTGHAIIQVDRLGENCIVLYGGANQTVKKQYVDTVLNDFGEGDYLLVQNELNMVDYIIDTAYNRGMTVVLNPSPYSEALKQWDLHKVTLFIINEIEGGQITGSSNPDEILYAMRHQYPGATVVLTLGKKGAVFQEGDLILTQCPFETTVVDTTAAGDTFTGYYIASIMQGMPQLEALKIASYAASLAVSQKGASASIPYRQEIETGLGFVSHVK
jgi:ribokinase